MQIKAGTFCPFVQGECLQTKCALFSKIEGVDKNTGREVEEWGCSLAWIPMLLVENSSQQRQTGAAVESFRNEMVRANDKVMKLALGTVQESGPLRIVSGDD